jgi:hypothetical protein
LRCVSTISSSSVFSSSALEWKSGEGYLSVLMLIVNPIVNGRTGEGCCCPCRSAYLIQFHYNRVRG